MFRFRYRWPTTASAAGRRRCSATLMHTAPRECIFLPAPRRLLPAGWTLTTAAVTSASRKTADRGSNLHNSAMSDIACQPVQLGIVRPLATGEDHRGRPGESD